MPDKHFHVCFAIQSVMENAKYMYTVENGKTRKAKKSEVYEAYKKAKSLGYDVLPRCNNIDHRGHCLGHDDGDEEDGWGWDTKVEQKTLDSFESELPKDRAALFLWKEDK